MRLRAEGTFWDACWRAAYGWSVKFLEENLPGPHLFQVEAQQHEVDGDAIQLVVTASPDAQDVIGQLVGLMLDSKVEEKEALPMTHEPVPLLR